MESKLKQLESGIWVFDSSYRGKCPLESTDQMAYGLWMQYRFPNALWFHVPNETGTKSGPQFVEKRRKMGVRSGVSDNVILTSGINHKCGLIELKRQDRTKSKVSPAQIQVLEDAIEEGHFGAIAYGLRELKRATLFYFGLPLDVD